MKVILLPGNLPAKEEATRSEVTWNVCLFFPDFFAVSRIFYCLLVVEEAWLCVLQT